MDSDVGADAPDSSAAMTRRSVFVLSCISTVKDVGVCANRLFFYIEANYARVGRSVSAGGYSGLRIAATLCSPCLRLTRALAYAHPMLGTGVVSFMYTVDSNPF